MGLDLAKNDFLNNLTIKCQTFFFLVLFFHLKNEKLASAEIQASICIALLSVELVAAKLKRSQTTFYKCCCSVPISRLFVVISSDLCRQLHLQNPLHEHYLGLISLQLTHYAVNFFGRMGIRARGIWVRSTNATSALRSSQ